MGVLEDYQSALPPGAWSDIQGHLKFIHDTVAQYEHPVVIELGVRQGYSTRALLSAVVLTGGELWSADVNAAEVPEAWHQYDCWHFMQGSDLDPEVQAWLPAMADVVFIDTSHEYDHTLAELREYVPRALPGGTVLLHDTEYSGDHPELRQPQPDFPVARALDTYVWASGWENRPGSYGLGVIRL